MELVKGTLDVLVLKTLSWGSLHGYAITRWIRRQTAGRLEVDDAALYQSLHRLERRGLVRAEWGLSENNRRAKYYELTVRGRTQLNADRSRWQSYAQAVFAVLDAEEA
jgi:transcriptional regulator